MNPDLSTRYLGLKLSGPLMASASPLTGTFEGLSKLQQAGASAAVMPSLFEEQIVHDELALNQLRELGAHSFPEAMDYAPDLGQYNIGPEAYLETLEQARKELAIPVIASLNGATKGGWVRYAQLMADHGAAALELNVYFVSADVDESGADVERRYLELVEAVRKAVSLPLSVKVGPGFSSPANMCKRLVEAGADGLVLFNRYLRPDVDLDKLEMMPRLVLSDSYEVRIPLQWIGILRGRVQASLAASSGVHTPYDALKLLLVGADVVMVTSALLQHGVEQMEKLLEGVRSWMSEHEYESVEQLKGSLCQMNCPDPSAFERANYMRALISYSASTS